MDARGIDLSPTHMKEPLNIVAQNFNMLRGSK